MMKRRDALKTIGGLAGAAAMGRLLPACGGDGDDGPVGITTYVFLMMENRTYDNVFGGRSLEGLPGDGLRAGLTNPDADGNPVAPYVPSALEMCTDGDPPHGWDSSHAQWNNGAMDGFVRAHQSGHPGAKDPMQYLTREQQPVSWALADAYTTCDRWFASVMGPTLPNRAYWLAGTSLGHRANDGVLDAVAGGSPVPTIFNRLDDVGVDWTNYFGNLSIVSILGDGGPYDLRLDERRNRIRRYGDAQYGAGQFFSDAAAGKLPPVVYIDPAFYENDDHPPIHPIMGQELIASVYTALATSPQWKNCLLVITYDEHGGFYDHVPPPTVTDDTLETYGVDGFQQLGFRVPTMVIGPYVKQGYVSSVQYDHTSALKHLQNTFGFEPLTTRMAMANDLSDCIDMDRLARGEWAEPAPIPMVTRDDWPHAEPRCAGEGSIFRHQDPISQWVDAHPGGIRPEYDIRGETNNHELIRDYVRRHRDVWTKR